MHKTPQDALDAYRAYTPTDSGTRHRHVDGLRYTDGVAFFATTFDAFWILDLIAGRQTAVSLKFKRFDLPDRQTWRIYRGGDHIVIDAWSDLPGTVTVGKGKAPRCLTMKVMEYCDLPVDLLPFDDLRVEDGVVFLKQEIER